MKRLIVFPRRGYVVFGHDIVMAAASFVLSLYLRLGNELLYQTTPGWLLTVTAMFTVVCAGAFWFTGLYRGVWRYASLNDLLAITRAVSLGILVFMVLMFAGTRLEAVPRSLPFINWFVLITLLGGPRFVYRLLKDRRLGFYLEKNGGQAIPVLLAGAGDGAELFLRALARTPDSPYRPVGIFAETPRRVGQSIHGVPVTGKLDDIAAALAEWPADIEKPQRLILTKDDFDGAKVRRLLETAQKAGMTLARLPRLTDLKSGIADRTEIKPIALEDLLGRPQTPLDRDLMRGLITGRRVLVTGAGGSIGSELVRQISDFEPAELVLLEHGEYNLYAIDLELAERHPALKRRPVLADVRDRPRLDRLFAEHRPELVFHAAALKHVPMVELNVLEGVMTNVVGTANVADACRAAGVATMVLISTDKAVNPTNVMGASKRIAESYCQAMDLKRDGGTRFVTVRFGNVLGSTGSVVPLFRQQLAAGGPLTVTDERMTRYFMTIREAVELVLEASAMGSREGEQEGKIFVLDMGEPVRIVELARQVIRLAGLKPDEDVKIEIIGPRPGEKLYEEKFHAGESLVPTAASGILLAAPRAADAEVLARAIRELAEACGRGDVERILEMIGTLVPEYRRAAASERRAASS